MEIHVDPEPIAKQVVLVGEDGAITPLLSDEASRALFLDERLRDRPVEIRGKRFRGVPYLQVITFKIEEDGRFQTPGILLRDLHDQRSIPADLPVLPGADGAADEARAALIDEREAKRSQSFLTSPARLGQQTCRLLRMSTCCSAWWPSWRSASTLLSMLCLLWVTRRRRKLADHTPPVTIFKPLKGLDEELEENLRSFFRLDYPTYQLLFCVADADDPAIARGADSCSPSSPTTTPSWSSAARPSGSTRRSRTWRRWTGTASTT